MLPKFNRCFATPGRYYRHPTPVMGDVTEAALTTGSWADINNADTNDISAADRGLLGGLPPL